MSNLDTYDNSSIANNLYKLRDFCERRTFFVIYNNLLFLFLFSCGILSIYKVMINGITIPGPGLVILICIILYLILLIYFTYVLSIHKVGDGLNKILRKSKNKYILSDYSFLDESTNMLYWTYSGVNVMKKRVETLDGLSEDIFLLSLKEFEFMKPLYIIVSESYYYKLYEFLKNNYGYYKIISLSQDLILKDNVVDLVNVEQEYLKVFISKEI